MTPLALAAFDRCSKFVFGELESLAAQARQKAPTAVQSLDDVWDLRESLLELSDRCRFAAYEIDTMRLEDEFERGLRQRYVPLSNCQLPAKKQPATSEDLFATFS